MYVLRSYTCTYPHTIHIPIPPRHPLPSHVSLILCSTFLQMKPQTHRTRACLHPFKIQVTMLFGLLLMVYNWPMRPSLLKFSLVCINSQYSDRPATGERKWTGQIYALP